SAFAPYIVKEDIADISLIGLRGRVYALGYLTEPSDTIIDDILAVEHTWINMTKIPQTTSVACDLVALNASLAGANMEGGIAPTDCNRSLLRAYIKRNGEEHPEFFNAIKGLGWDGIMRMGNLNRAIRGNADLVTNWNNYLLANDLNEFEFQIAEGAMGDRPTVFFMTHGDPSPIEQSFINYMRLKSF
ncbi:MAG: hypothetical protein HF967_05220, partial [Methanosarcinales archaeon]|nr:hypothetical protein [Methanosarcinales archaeon]